MSASAVEIRPATVADAEALATRLHPDDWEELIALGRMPRAALVESVEKSAEAWAGFADGELVCLFGVAPLTLVGVTGIPWLMGSPLVQQHARAFLRRNRQYIERWRQEFPILRNIVHARHRRAIRWLRWLGFTLEAPMPMPPFNEPFHPFTLEAK